MRIGQKVVNYLKDHITIQVWLNPQTERWEILWSSGKLFNMEDKEFKRKFINNKR